MARLSEIARISTAQPDYNDRLAGDAWMLWRAALSHAQMKKNFGMLPDPKGSDAAGYVIEKSLLSFCLKLWPERDWNDVNGTSPLYGLLRATGNAVCIEPGAKPPKWWIRTDWNDERVIVLAQRIAKRDKYLEADDIVQPYTGVTVTKKDTLTKEEQMKPKTKYTTNAKHCEARVLNALLSYDVKTWKTRPELLEASHVDAKTLLAHLDEWVLSGLVLADVSQRTDTYRGGLRIFKLADASAVKEAQKIVAAAEKKFDEEFVLRRRAPHAEAPVPRTTRGRISDAEAEAAYDDAFEGLEDESGPLGGPIVTEARASIALDRDQTHSVGPVTTPMVEKNQGFVPEVVKYSPAAPDEEFAALTEMLWSWARGQVVKETADLQRRVDDAEARLDALRKALS